jgi:hypothetical protein
MAEVDDRLGEKKRAEAPGEDERAEGPRNQTRDSPPSEGSRRGRCQEEDSHVLADPEQEPPRRLRGGQRRSEVNPQPDEKAEENTFQRGGQDESP